MKRVSLFTLCATLLGLVLFTASCKKGQDEVQPGGGTPGGEFVPSFVGVRWQMAGFELDPPQDFDGDGKPDSDLMQYLRPCDLDNTIVFERTGKMSGDNGKLTCDDDTDPAASKPSTWTYDNTAKKLRIVDGEDNSVSEWDVVEASTRYMKVKVTLTEDGQKVAALMTWKAV